MGRNVSTPKAQSSPETHQPLQAPSARVSQACPHGRTRDMQLERLAGSLGFLCVSHTRIPEPTGFFKYEEAESPKLCSSTEFNPKQPVSTFRPRGLAVSTLRPVLKNKSDSFNSRPVTKVHINQAVFRTLVKLFQIQDPLYKKLRTRTTGQVQSPTSGSSGDHLAPPPPEACIHPPQHSRQAALCHFGWLSVCLPPCRVEGEERGEHRTQESVSEVHRHHLTDTPEAAVNGVCSWEETGVWGQRPYFQPCSGPLKNLCQVLKNLCQVLFQQNLSLVRSYGTSLKSQLPGRLRPKDCKFKASLINLPRPYFKIKNR